MGKNDIYVLLDEVLQEGHFRQDSCPKLKNRISDVHQEKTAKIKEYAITSFLNNFEVFFRKIYVRKVKEWLRNGVRLKETKEI